MADPTLKLKPKLIELCKTPFIDEVNRQLDAGISPNAVCKFINQRRFKISAPLIYEYQKIRQQCVINNISMDTLLKVSQGKTGTGIGLAKGESFAAKKSKLKSEIDALDAIINMGFEHLGKNYNDDNPLPPSLMMSAIQLKNVLTQGSHGFLTHSGFEHLIEVEKGKYEVLFTFLMSYIPENQRQEVMSQIDREEEKYYAGTDYYFEYLKAKGYTDYEIEKKLAYQDTPDVVLTI